MEKINIAELLRDCPKGMELDCTIWDSEAKVFLKRVLNDNFAYPIEVTVKYNNTECTKSFTKYGAFNDLSYCKCVIFPKGKTTWDGFQRPFKDGDIIFTHANVLKVGVGNSWISIFKEKRNGGVATYVDYAEDGSDYYSDLDGDKALLCMESDILRQRFASEEEKAKLFKAIKDNGYRWDEKSKTLEKLTIFKVGDKIRRKNNTTIIKTIGHIYSDSYALYDGHLLYFNEQDNWELVLNKFDITTLKALQPVLVRNTNGQVWTMDLFSHKIDTNRGLRISFVCVGHCPNQCIPYKGNEHLLGTTNDCDDFYKTWE